MEENISKLLSEKLNIKELASKTLEYRVNGFFRACGLEFDLDNYEKSIQQLYDMDNLGIYTCVLIFNKGIHDEIRIYAVKKQSKKGDYIHLSCGASCLDFEFDNYYENKNIDKRIAEIPYKIVISNYYAGLRYILEIETTITKEAKITIQEEDGNVLLFYANITDFSKVLNIIKAFINNPEQVTRTYEEVFNKKKISFSNGELNKAIEYDEELEKPASKFVKRLKIVTNNEGFYKKDKNDKK